MKTGFILITTVILSGIFSLVNFYEYLQVAVFRRDDYPFGTEGPVGWNYKTAERYATTSLVSGILFLIPLVLCIWSYRRKKMKGMSAALWMTIGLIGLNYIMAAA